ncbi:uncharacterized protein BJ212DRAFT_1480902 [Suillus subaureus]|uniref:Uncharacterized protein n=1 Tax=Suillus subaureus TaxID=48587 RepID=A0A9P7EB79_9AGAM|nr:uncharacterized protein BJ212DRAFT_1480902 [Suillus subaureus]KAG1816453.1 hypothetical protein BJ212DRAFT_1480902 [Suillus subaureus]
MDIFKAIFVSDDEDSDEETDRTNDVDGPHVVSAPAGPSIPGPDDKPPAANGIVEDVDLATFKPTFIPRGSKAKDAEKNEKTNKKQKGSKVREAEKEEREGSNQEGDGGEDMWVKKPPPDIAKVLPITDISPDEGSQISGEESGPCRDS